MTLSMKMSDLIIFAQLCIFIVYWNLIIHTEKEDFYPEKYENPWELKEKIKIEEYALFMNIRYNIIISFLQIIYKFNVNTIKILSESLSREYRGYFFIIIWMYKGLIYPRKFW